MGWKPEVKVQGKWSQNSLVFTTEQEAYRSAQDLMARWIMVEEVRAVEVDEVANYAIINGLTVNIETESSNT